MSQETISITLQPRQIIGKGLNKLRREGTVPAVIHDHGKPSIVVMGPHLDLLKTYQKAGKNRPIKLTVESKTYTTLIKDVTLHPKNQLITHVVFDAVNANERVTAEVPVHIKFAEGNESTPAERAGLIVLRNAEVVEVEAVPSALPEALEFDGEKLVEVGDSATVADLIVPKDVVIKSDESTALATVFEPSALAAANDAAGGDAEPGDEAEVEAEHESNAEEGTQEEEIRPGGKKEFEDKEQGHNPTKQ